MRKALYVAASLVLVGVLTLPLSARALSLTRTLYRGMPMDEMVRSEVSQLQDFLTESGYLGILPDLVKGNFGKVTEEAIQKYQDANNLVPSRLSSDGYGIVGPTTRAKLSASFANPETAQLSPASQMAALGQMAAALISSFYLPSPLPVQFTGSAGNEKPIFKWQAGYSSGSLIACLVSIYRINPTSGDMVKVAIGQGCGTSSGKQYTLDNVTLSRFPVANPSVPFNFEASTQYLWSVQVSDADENGGETVPQVFTMPAAPVVSTPASTGGGGGGVPTATGEKPIIGWWVFDVEGINLNSSWVPDQSGYGHDAVFRGLGDDGIFLTSEGRLKLTGKVGQYAEVLEGKSTVANSTLGQTGDMTITAWIKPDNFDDNRGIVSKSLENIPAPFDFYLDKKTGKPVFLRGNGSGSTLVRSGIGLKAGEWNFIGLSVKGKNVSIVQKTQSTDASTGPDLILNNSTTVADNGGNLLIGNRADGKTPFSGELDNIRIYNQALSRDNVLQIFNSEKSDFVQDTFNYNPKTKKLSWTLGSAKGLTRFDVYRTNYVVEDPWKTKNPTWCKSNAANEDNWQNCSVGVVREKDVLDLSSSEVNQDYYYWLAVVRTENIQDTFVKPTVLGPVFVPSNANPSLGKNNSDGTPIIPTIATTSVRFVTGSNYPTIEWKYNGTYPQVAAQVFIGDTADFTENGAGVGTIAKMPSNAQIIKLDSPTASASANRLIGKELIPGAEYYYKVLSVYETGTKPKVIVHDVNSKVGSFTVPSQFQSMKADVMDYQSLIMFTWAYPNQSSYQLYKLSKYDDALTPSRKVESFTAMTKCQSGVSCNESEKVNFYQYFPKVKDSAWYKIAAVDAGGKIIAVTPAMKAAFPVPVVVDPVIDSFTLNTGVVTQDGGKVTVGSGANLAFSWAIKNIASDQKVQLLFGCFGKPVTVSTSLSPEGCAEGKPGLNVKELTNVSGTISNNSDKNQKVTFVLAVKDKTGTVVLASGFIDITVTPNIPVTLTSVTIPTHPSIVLQGGTISFDVVRTPATYTDSVTLQVRKSDNSLPPITTLSPTSGQPNHFSWTVPATVPVGLYTVVAIDGAGQSVPTTDGGFSVGSTAVTPVVVTPNTPAAYISRWFLNGQADQKEITVNSGQTAEIKVQTGNAVSCLIKQEGSSAYQSMAIDTSSSIQQWKWTTPALVTTARYIAYCTGAAETTPTTPQNVTINVSSAVKTQTLKNLALSSNGTVVSASSVYSSAYPVAGAVNGDRKGSNWGKGGGWNDGTANVYPDYFTLQFNGQKTVSEANIFSIQNSHLNPVEPTVDMTFTDYGMVEFRLQYIDGTTWKDIPGASAIGNNKVWRKFTFSPVTTDSVRLVITSVLNKFSRIAEIEIMGVDADAKAPATAASTKAAQATQVVTNKTATKTATEAATAVSLPTPIYQSAVKVGTTETKKYDDASGSFYKALTDGKGALTITAWISGGGAGNILGADGSISLAAGGGRISVITKAKSSCGSGWASPAISTGADALPSTGMHQVIYTRTAAGLEKIYVDGVEKATGTHAGAIPNNCYGAYFGSLRSWSSTTPTGKFTGTIGTRAIYSSVVNAMDLYNAEKGTAGISEAERTSQLAAAVEALQSLLGQYSKLLGR